MGPIQSTTQAAPGEGMSKLFKAGQGKPGGTGLTGNPSDDHVVLAHGPAS